MENEENLYPCLGLNYNMTQEQKQEAFQFVYDLLDKQRKVSDNILNQLYAYLAEQELKHIERQNLSDDLDIRLLRDIVIDLSLNNVGQWANFKLLHFLIYNKFPTEDAVEKGENNEQS